MQKLEFLNKLLALENPLNVDVLKQMENLYHFNSVKNSEIKFKWLRLCLKARWEDQISLALNFVNQQGRMKFTRPIYRDLYEWVEARDRAISNFKENKENMMFVSVQAIAKDLHL